MWISDSEFLEFGFSNFGKSGFFLPVYMEATGSMTYFPSAAKNLNV